MAALGEAYEWEVVYTDDSTLRAPAGDYADVDRTRIARVRLWDEDVLVLDLTPGEGQVAGDLVIRRRHSLGDDGHRMVWLLGFPSGPDDFILSFDPLTHEASVITNDVAMVPSESVQAQGAPCLWGSTRDAYTAGTTQPLDGVTFDTTSFWGFADVSMFDTSTIQKIEFIQTSPTVKTLWTESTAPYGDTASALEFANNTSFAGFMRMTLNNGSVIDGPLATWSISATATEPSPPSDLVSLIKAERAGLPLQIDTGFDAENWPEIEVTNLNSTGDGSLIAALNEYLNAGGQRTIVCTPGLAGTIPWPHPAMLLLGRLLWSFRMGNIKIQSTQNEDMFRIRGEDNIIIDGLEIEGPSGGEKDPIQIGTNAQNRSAGHTLGILLNRLRISNAGDECIGITEPKGEPQQVSIMRTWVSNPKGMLISSDAGGGTDPATAQWIRTHLVLCHFFACIGSNRNPKLKGVFGAVDRCLVEDSEFGTQLMDTNTGADAAGHTILRHNYYKSTVDGGRGGVFSGNPDIGDQGVYEHRLYRVNNHFDLSSSPDYHWGHGQPIITTDLSTMWDGAYPPDPNDVLGLTATPDKAQIETDVKQVAGKWEGQSA